MLFLGGLTYGEVLVIMRLSFAHSSLIVRLGLKQKKLLGYR